MNRFAYGTIAGFSLLLLYAATMSLLSGWSAALEQFRALWWLMVPLAAGFGVQVYLYVSLKEKIRQKTGNVLATSGAAASASMLACCAHHVTDVLPLLGLSGISLFLTAYQIPILIASLFMNVLGIYVMYSNVQKIIV